MKTFTYRINIKDKIFDIPVDFEDSFTQDEIQIKGEELLQKQWDLGKELVCEIPFSKDVTPEIINFLITVTGFTTQEIADYLYFDPSEISQWRSNKIIPNLAWQVMRIFLHDFYSYGSVINKLFIKNKESRASA